MDKAQPLGPAPSSAPRWALRLAIATWVITTIWMVVFAIFWRLTYLTPHGVWAVLSIATTVGTSSAAVVVGLWQTVRGPNRLVPIVAALLGAAPFVCLAIFFAGLKYRYTHHEVKATAPVRVAAFWMSSALDLEARWKYPRWTYGRHVVLIDDGQTPQTEQLVAQRDQHIDGMLSALGKPILPGTVRWVRGMLPGTGNLMLNWAPCGENRSPELSYLERHEVAHAAITAVCGPDQYPPTLLFEGWAESRSGDRAAQIRSLAQKHKKHQNRSLDEFIRPELYNLHIGEDHDDGAPLVHFLIEQYGASKFLHLYKEVRPGSFPDDCQRILGDSWPVVEQKFWQWLAEQAAALK